MPMVSYNVCSFDNINKLNRDDGYRALDRLSSCKLHMLDLNMKESAIRTLQS